MESNIVVTLDIQKNFKYEFKEENFLVNLIRMFEIIFSKLILLSSFLKYKNACLFYNQTNLVLALSIELVFVLSISIKHDILFL